MSRRRIVGAVLVAGIGVGGATALLDRGEARQATAAPVAGVSRAAAQRVPIRPAGPVTIVARADDPGGDRGWALRRFTTRSRGDAYPCLQLGRIDAGRFGWIAPGQPFRLARFDQLDVPTLCGETFPRGLPQLTTATLVTDAATGVPQPARTIVWGALPPGFTSAVLSDGTPLPAGRHGAVLAVLPARPLDRVRIAGTLRTSAGRSRRFAYPETSLRSEALRNIRDAARRQRLLRAGTPVEDRIAIAARAPDPAGGAGWGVLTAPSTTGRVCVSSPGRLVGDRLASIEPRLGIARPAPFAELDCLQRRAPTAAQPLRMVVAGFSVHDEDPVGTEQLRRLNDRTVLQGRTTADVREVTITTSRDIRTLVPDPRTHVFLAVYDGSFPGEPFRVTATLRDGSRRTVVQSSGG